MLAHATSWRLLALFLASAAALDHNADPRDVYPMHQACNRCEFEVVDVSYLDSDSFHEKISSAREPLILVDGFGLLDGTGADLSQWPLTARSWEDLAEMFNSALFRIGDGTPAEGALPNAESPYPEVEESLGFFVMMTSSDEQRERASGEAPTPRTVFQFGQVPSVFTLEGSGDGTANGVEQILQDCWRQDAAIATAIPFAKPLHENGRVACALLSLVRKPLWLDGALVTNAALLLGNRGSGIGYHEHSSAINALTSGEKFWVIESRNGNHSAFPTAKDFAVGEVGMHDTPHGHTTEERHEALLARRRTLPHGWSAHLDANKKTSGVPVQSLMCSQAAGEVIYIPPQAKHAAVVTSSRATAVQMQWDATHWGSESVRGMLETILAAGAGRGAQYELDNPEHARAEYMLDNNGEEQWHFEEHTGLSAMLRQQRREL